METTKTLKKYKNYLARELGLGMRSSYGYTNDLAKFFNWCEENLLAPNRIKLEELYAYFSYCRQQNLSDRTIYKYRAALKHYYAFTKRKSNPALFIKVAKQERTTPTNLLEEEFLEDIYRTMKANSLVQRRDKCILGLMNFQGLQRVDLEVLQVEHIDMEECRLYVPATTKTNERYIDLNRMQIMDLSRYVYDIRPQLLKEAEKDTNKLFFGVGTSANLNNVLSRMLKRLKKEFHYIKNFQQLRQSRVSIWVTTNGLRQAQYWGGFRYVTSVKRYDFKSVAELKEKLRFIHPLEAF